MVDKKYSGAIVLGLNDALIEMTGALAGLTFALKEPKIVAVTGLITGLAASLSMAVSEYLSVKEETAKTEKKDKKLSLKKALYTGTTYILAVVILILPYLILQNVYLSLTITLLLTLCLIAIYANYISKEKTIPSWKRFIKMTLITIIIAAISFAAGILLREFIL